jgi:RNase adaptor protein for sRNA GlmZ degradation
MKVKLIIGLPGSGKTFYLNSLDDSWHKIDDIKNVNELPFDKDKIAIADPHFCIDTVREKAKKTISNIYEDVEFEYIFFENDKEKCIKNVEYRNDGRNVMQFIEILYKSYNPPMNSIKIWQNK